MELKNIRRIGVFKFRNIGDVLMITPALRALRENFPDAHITVGVNSVTDAMLENNPHINRVLVYDRAQQNRNIFSRLAHELQLAREIRRARFDLTIDFTSGSRPAWYSRLSGAVVRAAFVNPIWTNHRRRRSYTHQLMERTEPSHEVERHLYLLEQLGIQSGSDKSLCLRTSPAAQQWARELIAPHKPKKIVHVHPVARWLFKCWDDKKMAAVIDWLELEKGAKVFVTGDAEEADELARTQSIEGFCKSKPVMLVGGITLSQLAALSEQADCFFGVDTAPMHIAAAVDTPVVSLFGPTGAQTWRPWCERGVTISKECRCNELKRQDCDWSPNAVRDCMQAIEVDEVKAALEKFL